MLANFDTTVKYVNALMKTYTTHNHRGHLKNSYQSSLFVPFEFLF